MSKALLSIISFLTTLILFSIGCSNNQCQDDFITDLNTQAYNTKIDIDNDGVEDFHFASSFYSSFAYNGASANIKSINDQWSIATTDQIDSLVIDTTGIVDDENMFSTLKYVISYFNNDDDEKWDSIRIRRVPIFISALEDVSCSSLTFEQEALVFTHHNSNSMYGKHDSTSGGFYNVSGAIIVVGNDGCYSIKMSYMDSQYHLSEIHKLCN